MIGWGSHLRERRIVEYCLAERSGESLDPRAAEHFTDCEACRARYTEMSGLLAVVRQQGDAEVDAAFSPEQLRAQQQQILRRIDQLTQGARVISFPGLDARRTAPLKSRVAPRWVAAAAAAGLFVGVGMGVFFDPRARLTVPTTASAKPEVPAAVVPPAETHADAEAQNDPFFSIFAIDGDDAMLMSQIDVVLERHTPELRALDALTPHFREASYRIQ